jgi:AraC-like DNA-binding protein
LETSGNGSRRRHTFEVIRDGSESWPGLASVEEMLSRYQSEHWPDTQKIPRELGMVLICIHESLFDPELNVKTIRARCRIRDNNLSSRFRYTLGQGIKEYIQRHRMAAAGCLLRKQGLAVFDVAMAVGYNHVETFYQVFRRHYGCTPGSYRQED